MLPVMMGGTGERVNRTPGAQSGKGRDPAGADKRVWPVCCSAHGNRAAGHSTGAQTPLSGRQDRGKGEPR
jgi:hypothetical protein